MKRIWLVVGCALLSLIVLYTNNKSNSLLNELISTSPEKFQVRQNSIVLKFSSRILRLNWSVFPPVQHEEYDGGVAYLGPTRGYTYANTKSLPVPNGRLG